MLSLVRGAQREIALCAYSITTGAATLLQEVKDVVIQGVNATIVVNALDEQPVTVQTYSEVLRRSFPADGGSWISHGALVRRICTQSCLLSTGQLRWSDPQI